MKVLTIWEPWATLYVHGIKKIETRPKPTSFKGTYLIHAAKKWSKMQQNVCLKEPFKSELMKLGVLMPLNGRFYTTNFSLGNIIGAVDVEECYKISNLKGLLETSPHYCSEKYTKNNPFGYVHIQKPESDFGDYTHGRYAWIGKNHRVLKTPIPYKGQQGYYAEFKGYKSQLIFK